MSRNEILREITSEEELANHDGGGLRQWWYEATQFYQCAGGKYSSGCDPNGPYGGSGKTSTGNSGYGCGTF